MIGSKESFIPVSGGRVYCRQVGGACAPPLLVVHGGPGIPHQQLQPLEQLSVDRSVIFYDQLGCGKSDRPDGAHLWQIDRFVDELDEVRNSLAAGDFHLLGYSWGSMIAVDYALRKPAGIRSLVLESPILSVARWTKDQERLRDCLPKEVRSILDRYEKGETGLRLEYKTALTEFRKRHMFRNLNPWPAVMSEAIGERNREVSKLMWGDQPFRVSGNLGDYEGTARLGEIEVPTLLTCGQYDTSTPETVRWYGSLLQRAESAVFENSSHWAHFEERRAFLATVQRFLRAVDRDC